MNKMDNIVNIKDANTREYKEKVRYAIKECQGIILTDDEYVQVVKRGGIKGFYKLDNDIYYNASNNIQIRVDVFGHIAGEHTSGGHHATKCSINVTTSVNTALISAVSAFNINVNELASTSYKKLSQAIKTAYGKAVNFVARLTDKDELVTYLPEDYLEVVKNILVTGGYENAGWKQVTEISTEFKDYDVIDTLTLLAYWYKENATETGSIMTRWKEAVKKILQENLAPWEGGITNFSFYDDGSYGTINQNGYVEITTTNNKRGKLISYSSLGTFDKEEKIQFEKSTQSKTMLLRYYYDNYGNISRWNDPIYSYDEIIGLNTTYSGGHQGFLNLGYLTDFTKKPTGKTPTLDPISTTYPNWYNKKENSNNYEYDENDPENPIKEIPYDELPVKIIPEPEDEDDYDNDIDNDNKPEDNTQEDSQSGDSDEQDVQDGSDNATDDVINQGFILPTGKANYDLGKTASTTGHKLFNPVSTFFSIPYKFNLGSEGSKMLTISSWLWSDSGLKELLKFFANDPFQAIISCKAIPCPCSVASGEYPVVFGSLQVPNVTAKVITERMHVVNCGSLSIDEHFENCMDFAPYTSVSLYLPFIGIVSLEVDDIMSGVISVSYNVDTITGDAICNVTISRNEMIAVLYQYPCNVAVDIPISGADYSAKWGGAVAGLGSLATGLVMKKPAMAVSGLVGGALALSKGGDIQRSGQLTGNTGALGFRRPYLIINRPVPDTTFNFEKFQGIGSHQNVYIKNLTGYNRCKEVHVDGISNATNSEKDMIENVLKGGFVI